MKLRNVFSVRPTPNQTRMFYDFFVISCAAITTSLFSVSLLDVAYFGLLFASPMVLVTNSLLGVYSRFKVGTGWLKTILLTSSIAITSLFLLLQNIELSLVLLWVSLSWAPLVLPRLFLNLPSQVKTNFIKRTLRDRGPILIVGGAGYIGSYVIEQLLEAGENVRVLDRLIHGKEPIAEFMNNSRFEFIEGDATDIIKLTQAVNGVSTVIHLAGLVGDPACAVDEAFTRHANVISTRMVKEVALSLGVTRFIFSSSCSVYGANDNEVDETSTLNPVSTYAKTKIDSEQELLLCLDENFCVTILRFATVFGHSRRPRFDLVANLFTAQAMTEGKITVIGEDQWRPFIHVNDVARAIVLVAKANPEKVRSQIFNVGDKRLNKTIGQLATTVFDLVKTEKPVEIVKRNDINDRRNYRVSFNKIKNTLGFEASILLEDGIKEIIHSFKQGTYQHYSTSQYSNLEMTKIALRDFQDPMLNARLYSPISAYPDANTLVPAEMGA